LDYALLVATALHALTVAIVIGFYGVLGRIVIPAAAGALDAPRAAAVVASVGRRSLPILIGATAILILSGMYLMTVDARYGGLGALASGWTQLILTKHLVVVAFVIAAAMTSMSTDSPAATDDPATCARRLRRLGLLADGTAALGVLAIVFTAAAQLAA
jgi:uncharacterized membrane protein